MKLYPKPNGHDRGFTEEEIRRNIHTLYIDVQCVSCGKNQSLAQVGGWGGKCIRCGGETK
jgi:ribosomal protein S27E